jgi:hypothetical protein
MKMSKLLFTMLLFLPLFLGLISADTFKLDISEEEELFPIQTSSFIGGGVIDMILCIFCKTNNNSGDSCISNRFLVVWETDEEEDDDDDDDEVGFEDLCLFCLLYF